MSQPGPPAIRWRPRLVVQDSKGVALRSLVFARRGEVKRRGDGDMSRRCSRSRQSAAKRRTAAANVRTSWGLEKQSRTPSEDSVQTVNSKRECCHGSGAATAANERKKGVDALVSIVRRGQTPPMDEMVRQMRTEPGGGRGTVPGTHTKAVHAEHFLSRRSSQSTIDRSGLDRARFNDRWIGCSSGQESGLTEAIDETRHTARQVEDVFNGSGGAIEGKLQIDVGGCSWAVRPTRR